MAEINDDKIHSRLDFDGIEVGIITKSMSKEGVLIEFKHTENNI